MATSYLLNNRLIVNLRKEREMKKIILISVLILGLGQAIEIVKDYNRMNTEVKQEKITTERQFDSMYCKTLQRNGQDCTQAWK